MAKFSFNKLIIDFKLWLGVAFIISPIILYWFIHGSYERYIWIINSPYPFSNLGSGPFQLFLYIGMIAIGIVIILCSCII